ncbi:MAG: hypothetical protein ABI867_14795 [Kofleriaceae bacterium]
MRESSRQVARGTRVARVLGMTKTTEATPQNVSADATPQNVTPG